MFISHCREAGSLRTAVKGITAEALESESIAGSASNRCRTVSTLVVLLSYLLIDGMYAHVC